MSLGMKRFSAQKLSLGLLWKELEVYSKLVFRGRNQHRRDKTYQMLVRISKDLNRYKKKVPLMNIVKNLTKLEPEQVKSLAKKLLNCIQFTTSLLQFLEITFKEVEKQLCMSLFVPTNLLMASSLSRMWYILQYHSLALSEFYSELPSLNVPVILKTISSSPLTCIPVHQKTIANSDVDLGTVITRELSDVGKTLNNTEKSNQQCNKARCMREVETTDISDKESPNHPKASKAVQKSLSHKDIKKRCVINIVLKVGNRTLWFRLNRRSIGTQHRYISMLLNRVKILSMRRKSVFTNDFVVSKAVVITKNTKLRAKRSVPDATSQDSSQPGNMFKSQSLNRNLMDDFEVEDYQDSGSSTVDSRPSHVIDDIFDNIN